MSGQRARPMDLRPKGAADVRRDALAAAVSKARQGCHLCAEHYLDLAVANARNGRRGGGGATADVCASRVTAIRAAYAPS